MTTRLDRSRSTLPPGLTSVLLLLLGCTRPAGFADGRRELARRSRRAHRVGLWRVDVDPPVQLAAVTGKRSRFPVDDAFCSAPLAVFRGELHAGDQRDGALWRIRSSSGI